MSTKYLLQLTGRSGCPIQVIQNGNFISVLKTSNGPAYNRRLENQITKQEDFLPFDSCFIVPKILNSGVSGGLTYAQMEYISGENFSNFFQNISIQDIDILVEKFKDYFLHTLKNSSFKNPTDEFLVKFNSIDLSMLPTSLSNKISVLISGLPASQIPYGGCHGDLTFSNMLFISDKIVLLDFLDSFIESPLIDMVKLRQDSKYGWSLLIQPGLEDYKRLRSKQVFHYIDRKLSEWFEQFPWYKDWYIPFQLLNFLRIFPYLNSGKEKEFVLKCLQDLIYEVNHTNSR